MVNLEVYIIAALPCVVLLALLCVIRLTATLPCVVRCPTYTFYVLPPLAGRAPCMALRVGCYVRERENIAQGPWPRLGISPGGLALVGECRRRDLRACAP